LSHYYVSFIHVGIILATGLVPISKNNEIMTNLTYHENDFDLTALWTFLATSHGNGSADGIGATVKSHATRYLLGGTAERVFLSTKGLFAFYQTSY
jgi:hypothetical protein